VIGVRFSAGARDVYPGTLSLGVNPPGREDNHVLPNGIEVRSGGAILLLPHTPSWRGAQLIKHRDNFTFYLLCDLPRNLAVSLTYASVGKRSESLIWKVVKANFGTLDIIKSLASEEKWSLLCTIN
jgi:hypothetical protein